MNYPQFLVMLDVARGSAPHTGNCAEVGLMLDGGFGDEGIYRLLCAGQFQIEGGYPCMPPCEARHPALRVARTGGPLGIVETVWRAGGPAVRHALSALAVEHSPA